MVTSVLTVTLWYFITAPYSWQYGGMVHTIGPFDNREVCQTIRGIFNKRRQIDVITPCYSVNYGKPGVLQKQTTNNIGR